MSWEETRDKMPPERSRLESTEWRVARARMTRAVLIMCSVTSTAARRLRVLSEGRITWIVFT